MKNFTKSGFLYYELSQLQGKPAIIIYSDKETESKIFANDAVRREYMDSLSNILKEAGVTLYQVPYSAVWINPLTLLSVRTANSKLIVLEFPWGYSKQLKYPNIQLVKEVYDEIVKNLNPNGTADKYLTKAEAEDTYLSIADAEATYATNNSVDIKLDNKANLDDIPTKVSELTNDANYVTTVALDNRGYLTADEAKDTYATQANVTNDLKKKADKANTLAGYGIDDAYTKAEVNAKVSSVYKYKGSVANYEALPKEDNVIGDVYNVEDTGANYAWDGTAWDKLSETIDLTNYITNEKLTEELNKKADKAESLAGYGIADAYTIRQTDAKFDKKADKTAVVDLTSNQEIAGNKSFTGEVSINGTLNDASYGKVISTTAGTLSLGDETKNIVLKAKDNAIVQKGSNNYVVLDSENYGDYIESAGIATTEKAGLVKPDGTTITITADGTITSVGGGSISGEKYGIRGDYSTRYGIVECPNGLISYTGKNLTFADGIKVELAGKDQKALIGGALHTVESNMEFDLFYIAEGGFSIGGEMKNFLECSDVFYQETEPEDGQANCAAWWNPTKQIWSFKSNAAGNVWTEAVACRIAHIHVNEENITGISYAGNRLIDDEIFVEKHELKTVAFSGKYTDLEDKPVIPEAYELPKASATTLGGIKVGDGLAISNEGVLSATTVAGTTDYTELTNKPSINSIELNGNKTLDQLGIQPKGNYLIEADLADYAKTSAIPTNVSQLTNDAGYITGVPDNYVTDEKLAEKNYVSNTELTEKDYATNAAVTTALAAKADTSSLATVATSGSYNDLNDKPTIPAAYELPTASTSTLGGVKIDGTTIVINDGVISASNGGSGGTSNYAELTNKPTINNVELTGNKTSSDLNLTSNTNAVINNSLTLQEGDASLKVNFVETSDNKKVSEVQINGADYIDVLAQTHFLVAPTCGEQASYTDNEFMPKKSILSLIHMYSPKVHTDVVLTSSVKDDGDTTYPYLNTFNVADAEATDIPTVILSSDQVLSGNWSSISETVAGAVTIRTKVEIAEGTTIPQIILQKSTN